MGPLELPKDGETGGRRLSKAYKVGKVHQRSVAVCRRLRMAGPELLLGGIRRITATLIGRGAIALEKAPAAEFS